MFSALVHQFIRFGETRTDGGLNADRHPAQVLGRDEFAGHELQDNEGRNKEKSGQNKNKAGTAETAAQNFGIGSFQPAKAFVHREPDPAPAFPGCF